MNVRPLVAAFALATPLSFVSAVASAQGTTSISVSSRNLPSGDPLGYGWSGGLLLGYGFADGVKAGIGARVGYTLPQNVYLGGTLVYHFGDSQDYPFGGSISEHLLFGGFEGGYDIVAGPVVVRPFVGLGIASATVDYTAPSGTPLGTPTGSASSGGRFAIWPGATVLYPVAPDVSLGVDGRFLIVDAFNSFNLYLTGAYHF